MGANLLIRQKVLLDNAVRFFGLELNGAA